MPALAPPPLLPPVEPVVVQARFIPAARYAAGGRRPVRLRARPGARIVAPCGGRIAFSGIVAGRSPALTIACDFPAMRLTLSGIAPTQERGAAVATGDGVGRTLGAGLGLSVRIPRAGYVDPLPLLRRGSSSSPPVAVPGRRAHRSPRRSLPRTPPEIRLDRAVRVSPAAPQLQARGAARSAPDPWLGIAGLSAGLLAFVGLGPLTWRRWRRRVSRPQMGAAARPLSRQ